MQSVCDLGRSLTAPSPLPVDSPIFAYFGLTGINHWKMVTSKEKNAKKRCSHFQKIKRFSVLCSAE
jgi:hypothetical protein